MKKEITKEDLKSLFWFGITLVGGIWVICTRDFSGDNLANHIKFFYSVLLFVAISAVASLYLFKLKSKKEKENGSKKK